MIKNYAPQPYDGTTALPQYVTDVSTYTLIGEVPGGYKITLAELSVGSSVSAGNPLTHALFKSYSDHELLRPRRADESGPCESEWRRW